MKTSATLLFCFLVGMLLWTGCGSDDEDTLTTLNYDGPNVNAPQLPPGRNVFGVYFPPSETAPYQGRVLESVRFYMSDIPDSTIVVVYDEGPDDRTPGAELYRRNITGRVNVTAWIDDRLNERIVIGDRGIWLAIEVVIPPGEPFSVGCDAGRNFQPNGNLLFLSTESDWTTFEEITDPNNNGTGETVNWNIRGVLSAE
ncbi:hypothetical protein CLV84_0162 [Neolewinella xylanilytica]|uniref:Uncharacterized protein n=1 Tax=Neolewinella xylanilytica TaxID=1514080 RepID=A0A2S6I6X4_9BACT|nr:hypothetical protein [Neolewinella xylanilytica]PPK87225.1 hypothetical protein CLV84_0162 [Neolewinella xylanilytica]